MTGCPNGCARPYMAELGFVGKRPSVYALYLGGNEEHACRVCTIEAVSTNCLRNSAVSLPASRPSATTASASGISARASCGPSRMQPNFNGGFNDCRRDWTGQRDVA